MVRHPLAFFRRGFCRANIQMAVDLHRVGRNDLAVKRVRQADGKRGFSAGGRTGNDTECFAHLKHPAKKLVDLAARHADDHRPAMPGQCSSSRSPIWCKRERISYSESASPPLIARLQAVLAMASRRISGVVKFLRTERDSRISRRKMTPWFSSTIMGKAVSLTLPPSRTSI